MDERDQHSPEHVIAPDHADADRVFPGGGDMAARCRAHDWAATPLGPVDRWPAALRAAVRLMLGAPVATSLWVGADYTLLYNDAYARILGAKHPHALGRSGAAVWDELWPALEPQFAGIRGGGPPVFADDALLRMERLEGGRAEDAWFTYALSALTDDAGTCLAVYNVAVEVTERARAAHQRDAERARLAAVFEQSPSFLHVLRGPDFVFELANAAYYQLVGHRALIGRPAFEAMPEAAGGGFPEHIARVMATRQPFVGRELPVLLARTPGAPVEERLIDLVYVPLVEADGTCERVLGHGTDVTDAVRTRREVERLLAESDAANAQLRDQALELELANQQLQDTAVELEAASEEQQVTAEELAERTRVAEDAATALAESEARFRAVQDASPLGFAIHRPLYGADGTVVDFTLPYINEAGARIVGHSREHLLAGTVLGIWPGTGPEGVFADYVRVLETGEPGYREILYEHDELSAGLTLTVVRIRAGADAELAITFTDVTARLRAERERDQLLAELGTERERLRAVILNMPSPLALHVGPEHRFELINAAFRRISGGGRDDTGLTVRAAFPELAGQGIIEALDRVYATGEPWIGNEIPIRYDRDGTGLQDTWYNVRYEPVRGPDGAVWGVLNFAVDVTDQVRARREVEGLLALSEEARGTAERARAEAEAARTEAQAANRAKSEFLAVMSHELRTPLNAIGGYSELIELGIHGPITDAQRAALERIQVSQRHLLGLIAGVLDYSRVEAGAVTYRLHDVPVSEVVAEAESLIAPQLRAQGLGYSWSGASPRLAVRADREKLQQILLNLLGNAIKFTQMRNGVPGRIEVSCTVEAHETAGEWVHLQVRDTGMGIAPDALERIFEPFVQADQRLTRAHAGVGLGLAISRDLARGMGGDLTVESAVGAGSTFRVTLPRA